MNRLIRKTLCCIAPCAATLLLGSAPVAAQVHVGPQLSLGTDSGAGLGARILFPLRRDVVGLEGALDGNYFFGGGDLVDSWIDVNANLRLPIPIARDFTTRIGAGLNLTFISIESPGGPTSDTDSEVGLNLLAAIEGSRGRIAPFGELRLVLGSAEQLVVTAGFTVGGRAN